jgi:hypothetical protein
LSDQDSFIEEVTEEVRRDRLFGLWKKYAPFVIGAVIAIVAATALASWLDHRAEQSAREAGAALLAAGEQADPADRASSLLALADGAEAGTEVIALMQAGAAMAADGDLSAAADAFDRAARAAAAIDEPALSALAAYRAALLRLGAVDHEESVGALSALTTDDNPMRLLALEARALTHMEAGDTNAARADLETVLADAAATEGTRQRARDLLATLDSGE